MSETSNLIIDALSHLICGTAERHGDVAPIHYVNRQTYDGFDLLQLQIAKDDDFVLLSRDPSDQPVWPVDVVWASRHTGDKEWPEGSWQFDRYKTLHMKDWRGKITHFFPRMLDHCITVVAPDGKCVSARVPYAIVGQKLLDVPRAVTGLRIDASGGADRFMPNPGFFGTRNNADNVMETKHAVLFIGGLALRKRYNWSVLLGEGNGPRARLITDVQGIREVFRLRDIPAGRQRRQALLHWVREHWRKRRNVTANDRIWVNKHISGAWSFNWNGLRGQIEPSVEDLEWLSDRYVNKGEP